MSEKQSHSPDSDLKVGQVVRSKAGRDKGNWLIVTEIIDSDNVNVCDGNKRKISKPKKKKVKHLARTNYVCPLLKEKKKKNLKVTNSDIRKILKPFNLKTKS